MIKITKVIVARISIIDGDFLIARYILCNLHCVCPGVKQRVPREIGGSRRTAGKMYERYFPPEVSNGYNHQILEKVSLWYRLELSRRLYRKTLKRTLIV